VLRESELVRWLQRHPSTLTPSQVQNLAANAAQPAAWQRMPETDTIDYAAFDRLRSAVDGARRRRIGWMLGVVVATPIALLTMPSALIALVTG
jgi:hypothetical protein